MGATKIIAILLLVAGAAALAFGSFSYTQDKTVMKVGSLEVTAKQKEQVNLPVWLGVGALVAGGLLLVFGSRR
jgi:drug/metabolite transporter (DMT)-like permease